MELKNCPFCGENLIPICGMPIQPGSFLHLDNDCILAGFQFNNAEKKVDAWNRRASGWVSVEEKKPIQDDANKWGQVFVMYENGLISEYPYHLIKQNSGITHWMPLPQPPKEVK